MSNSNMVTYTKLSPNHSGPRTHTIDTITIHHMAGNLSVQTCGDIFAKSSRQASSNYGVSGKEVGLYVDEANRSWCSSNRVNDQRAITFEVANDTAGVKNKTWTVSDETMATLIELVTDVCKRNNIKKLIWSSNKNDRINHINGCNMTLHKDFAATACPGPYLEGKMQYIADEVNKRLGEAAPETPATTPTKLFKVQIGAYRIRTNAQKALEDAKQKGFKDAFIKQYGTLYKVQIGAYKLKVNAVNMQRSAINKGYKDAFIVEE